MRSPKNFSEKYIPNPTALQSHAPFIRARCTCVRSCVWLPSHMISEALTVRNDATKWTNMKKRKIKNEECRFNHGNLSVSNETKYHIHVQYEYIFISKRELRIGDKWARCTEESVCTALGHSPHKTQSESIRPAHSVIHVRDTWMRPCTVVEMELGEFGHVFLFYFILSSCVCSSFFICILILPFFSLSRFTQYLE